jgi:hypothetical protein
MGARNELAGHIYPLLATRRSLNRDYPEFPNSFGNGVLGSLHSHGPSQTLRGGEGLPPGIIGGTMGWRREIRDVIAQLEQQRSRLEEVRERAKRQGGPEGERLEAQATARLREIEQRIADLRTSLEE